MNEIGEVSFEGEHMAGWHAFLQEVSRTPGMEFVESRVREIDAQVQHRYLIRLRPAKTSAIDGSLILVWTKNEDHLELELTKDEFEWFYRRDFDGKRVGGTELDDRAVEFLAEYGT